MKAAWPWEHPVRTAFSGIHMLELNAVVFDHRCLYLRAHFYVNDCISF